MFRGWRRLALVWGFLCAGACQFPAYDVRDSVPITAGVAGQSGAGGVAAGGNGGSALPAGTAGQVTIEGGAGGQPSELIAGAAGEGGTIPGEDLLFSDDFENGGDAWSPTSPPDWSLATDGSNTVYRQGTVDDGTQLALAGDASWTDVSVEARVRVTQFGGTDTADLAAVFARCQDLDNYYYLALRSDGRLAIKGRINGSDQTLASSVDPMLAANTWYEVKLEVVGDVIKAYLDGVRWSMATVDAGDIIPAGAIGLGTSNTSAEFDDVVVRAIP